LTTAYADLNPILARWLSFAREEAAVDCAGCARAAKCCDFQPFVAGFLLGALLEEGVELPRGDFHYTPLGLVASQSFRAQHAASTEGLACAFFDRENRQCQIWSKRPGECSTYLCTPVTSARGRHSQEVFDLEVGLSQMALVYQGYSADEIAREVDFLNAPSLRADDVDPSVYAQAWQWARKLSAVDVQEILRQ
jgi:Fe-S-cluster containining protein